MPLPPPGVDATSTRAMQRNKLLRLAHEIVEEVGLVRGESLSIKWVGDVLHLSQEKEILHERLPAPMSNRRATTAPAG